MRIPRIVWLPVVLLALFASACSADTEIIDATASNGADPEPTPEPEGDPPPTPEPDEADAARRVFGSEGFGGELTDEELGCALDALRDRGDLFDRVLLADDPLDLPIDDQAEVALIAFDCAPDAFTAGFVEGFEGSGGGAIDVPPSVVECLIDAMGPGAANRSDVALGFAALGADSEVPLYAQEAVIETMVECLPGDVFADAILAEALADPALATAVDAACMQSAFTPEVMRPLWTALVTDPDAEFETLPPQTVDPMLEAMFGCLSFGRILAAEAAAAGVSLSSSSISCIDDTLAGIDLAAAIRGDEPPPGFEDALLACLSPEEVAALGG